MCGPQLTGIIVERSVCVVPLCVYLSGQVRQDQLIGEPLVCGTIGVATVGPEPLMFLRGVLVPGPSQVQVQGAFILFPVLQQLRVTVSVAP